jgi:predicted small integral membrane protein
MKNMKKWKQRSKSCAFGLFNKGFMAICSLFILIVQLLAIAVVIFGVWMSTHHDGCRRSLTLPVLGLGAFIFLM